MPNMKTMTEPAQETTDPQPSSLDELVKVMARLRAPGGCAWDAEQTHSSLVPHLIEETHELVEAVEAGNRDDLIEELGDVLYQVLFHADIAAATPGEDFDIQDVAARMTRKMISRHPHVFSDAVAETSDAVIASWDLLKAAEKPHRTSVLDGIPQSMPALALADKLLGRAQKVGINVSGQADDDAGDQKSDAGDATLPASERELGELLLKTVGQAKQRGMNAERALRGALRKLQAEIRAVERPSAAD